MNQIFFYGIQVLQNPQDSPVHDHCRIIILYNSGLYVQILIDKCKVIAARNGFKSKQKILNTYLNAKNTNLKIFFTFFHVVLEMNETFKKAIKMYYNLKPFTLTLFFCLRLANTSTITNNLIRTWSV